MRIPYRSIAHDKKHRAMPMSLVLLQYKDSRLIGRASTSLASERKQCPADCVKSLSPWADALWGTGRACVLFYYYRRIPPRLTRLPY